MIGAFDIEPPPIDDDLSQMVESHRMETGQDYAAILFFGLWGTVDCSSEIRLYAGYRHLADHPEDGPAWLEISRVHLEEGDTAAAGKIIDELEKNGNPGLYPQLYNEDPDVQRAYIMAETGAAMKAVEILDELKSKHDDSPVYHFFIGNLLHEGGDALAAAGEYRQALGALRDFEHELDAEDIDIEETIDFREVEKVIEEFLEATETDPENFVPFRPLDLSDFREE